MGPDVAIGATCLTDCGAGSGIEDLVLAAVDFAFMPFDGCLDVFGLVTVFCGAGSLFVSSPSKGEPFRIEPRPCVFSAMV